MGLGLSGQMRVLQERLNPKRRLVNFALRFRVYTREGNLIIPTNTVSPTYGGIWDYWLGKYLDDPVPEEDVYELRCSTAQYELLCSTKSKVEASGGRGSGKSEGGILWVLKNIVTMPGENGRVLSPTFPLTRVVWSKLFRQVPNRWIVPGLGGISKSSKEVRFLNGHILSFNSATNPESLVSWGGAYTLIDEAQDVSTDAVDTNWFCLRESANPRVLFTMTPDQGNAYQRHVEMKNNPDDCKLLSFSSYTNPFISKKVFDLANKFMDRTKYSISVEADWDVVARLEEESVQYVFSGFVGDDYAVEWPPMGMDKTSSYISRKLNTTRHHDYIIGIDPNWTYPNFAVIYKIFTPLEKGGMDRWIAIDVLSGKGHCGHFGKKIKEAGYGNGIIIPDASSHYWKGKGPKSSERLLREQGFVIKLDRKNPLVVTSVDALRARLFPVEGMPTWGFRKGRCEALVEAMEHLQWKPGGKELDKSEGWDHVVDAARYPVGFFSPAASEERKFNRLLASEASAK